MVAIDIPVHVDHVCTLEQQKPSGSINVLGLITKHLHLHVRW